MSAELHAELDGPRADRSDVPESRGPKGTYVTLSYSDNVLRVLKAAHERVSVARVFVMESGPMFEEGLAKSSRHPRSSLRAFRIRKALLM